MASAALLLFAGAAQAQPVGGQIASGSGVISQAGAVTDIHQASQNLSLTWDSFNIAAQETVNFVQPSTSAIAVNRIFDANGTQILGQINANGQVYLINPNGIMFGRNAQVNVGGLVASTLHLNDASLSSDNRSFSGSGDGAVLNLGAINAANGGYVALLGNQVGNQGVITAHLGAVMLGAGTAATLRFSGNDLVSMQVDQNTLAALAENGGLIQAGGGVVVMTAGARDSLLASVVNNTGVIEAHTVENHAGVITLLAGMSAGETFVGGALDASAPNGGDGGFIETSAAHVHVAGDAHVTTAAASGEHGTWLIDPQDFIIGPGGNISGATLSAQLVTTNVIINTATGPGAALPGNGDIFVNEAIAWTASGAPTTLSLLAVRDVNINAAITATNGNLVVCCSRDVNVNAPITTTNGSILLNAGQNVNVFHVLTTTDGNIALCAGHDVIIDRAITLTRGSTIPAQALGLPVGLTIIAGADGTGPEVGGGTVVFTPLSPPVTVTNAPATINYNPVSYAAPSDFFTEFTLTEGATLTQRMLLFPTGDRVFDGTTATTLTGFNTTAVSGLPLGVTLVASPGASAVFDSADVGAGIGITYSGYTLAGANADQYALAGSCCVSTFRTTGTISAAAPPPPPPPPPPPVVPPLVPPVVPPPVTPPVVPPVTPPAPPPAADSTSGTPLVQSAVFIAQPGVSLAVMGEGVRLPASMFAEAPLLPAEEEFAALDAPAPAPAPFYVPRQDRH